MPYRVRVTDAAREEMLRLPGNVRQRIRRLVEDLGADPRPSSARELRDLPGPFRVRLGDWRIIYRVDDQAHTVTVLTVRRKIGPETYGTWRRQAAPPRARRPPSWPGG